MKRASGFSLVELLVALSLLGMVLSGTIGLVAMVRTSTHNATSNRLHRQEIRRFADDLRRDVHAANSATVENDELILAYASNESTATYRADSQSSLHRTVADDSASSRDAYKVPSTARIRFESIDDGRLIRVTFTDPDRPLQPIEIIATRKTQQ